MLIKTQLILNRLALTRLRRRLTEIEQEYLTATLARHDLCERQAAERYRTHSSRAGDVAVIVGVIIAAVVTVTLVGA
jgi:hypothetical protein